MKSDHIDLRKRIMRAAGAYDRPIQTMFRAGLALATIMVLGVRIGKAMELPRIQAAPHVEATGQNAPADASAPRPKSSDAAYLIGPSDMLAISVWKDTELTRTIPVRPDGKITMPLIGDLTVSGLTAEAAQELIAQKLKEFISDPQVTVIVQEVKSRTYSILGKVAKPGSYPLGKPTAIIEAIAIAGGFQDFARENKIYILRPKSDGSVQTIPFDYKKAIRRHNPEENIEIQSGDTIIVP